jgi:aryl-alcohol dehydrogenase-like predicted oxidoreductase
MPLTRRTFLKTSAAAGAALLLEPGSLLARLARQPLLTRAIPRTGERVPIVGLGSVSMFEMRADDPAHAGGQEVIRLFHELGGRVIDTAAGYRNAEAFIGETVRRFGIQDDLFLATKFSALQLAPGAAVRPSGGRAADRAVMESQMRESLARFGRTRLDLQQVWNLGDVQSNAQVSSVPAGQLEPHMEAALEWKRTGLTRYIGITTSRAPQYGELEQALARYPIDFVQLDYSVDNLEVEARLLPAAADNGVAVLVNRPFGSGTLFRQATARGKTLPPWAAELGITSWAQYFLKFIVSHPAVTAAIPATSNPVNLRDNMGAATGELPDAAARRRMLEFWRT